MAHMAVHLYLSVAVVYGMGVFFSPIIAEMGWTRTQISLAAGLQRIEGSIASPVVGFLADRFGSRRVVVPGVLLGATGMVLLSRVDSLVMFYLAYLVVAAGLSFTIGIPFTVAVANWFNRKQGRAMGLMFTGATFAGLFVPLLALGTVELGWRTTMLLCGLGFLVVGLPAAMAARHRPEPYGYLPDGDDPGEQTAEEKAAAGRRGSTAPGHTAREALRTPSFWLLTLTFGLVSMGPSAMFLHQVPYFMSIGFSPTAAASTVATFTLLSGIGRVGGGWLMDYVDRRLVLAGLIGLSVVGFLVVLNTTQYWHSVVYALCFGVSFGGSIPARPIFTRAYFGGRAFGAITGLMQSLAVAGGIVAPVLMGWIYDATGSYKPAVLTLTVLISLAIPLTFLLRTPGPDGNRGEPQTDALA